SGPALVVARHVDEDRFRTRRREDRFHRGLEREERALETGHMRQRVVDADAREVAHARADDVELVEEGSELLTQVIEHDDAPLAEETVERRRDVLVQAVHHPSSPGESAW